MGLKRPTFKLKFLQQFMMRLTANTGVTTDLVVTTIMRHQLIAKNIPSHDSWKNEEQRAKEIALHQETLRRVTSPLPGKDPQDNFRPLKVHARHEGSTILDFICDLFL